MNNLPDPEQYDLLERLREIGVTVTNIGGFCPVQAEGEILHESGKRVSFYFRARGENWSIEIGRKGREMAEDAWGHREPWPGKKYEAGYMSKSQALALIERGIEFWRKAGAPLNPGHDAGNLLAILGRNYDQIKRLGFNRWVEGAGNSERDLFVSLHDLGTVREEKIGARLRTEISIVTRAQMERQQPPQDNTITAFFTDQGEQTIKNILDMQR